MTSARIKHLIRGCIAPSLLLLLVQTGLAESGMEEITYAKHVVPIFQEKCQICHQPNSVAQISLLTYQDAVNYGPLIKFRVANRVMPPWHIDTTVGIQDFKNSRGLSDEQIDTIVGWVDGGMAFGNENDLPPPKKFPDPNRWQLADQFGEPDLIVRSDPYTLAAETQDKWFRPVVETGLTEARWVRAIEMKPSYPDGRKIVHHSLTFLEQDEENLTGIAPTNLDEIEALVGSGGMLQQYPAIGP